MGDLEATIQSGEVPVRSNLAQKMERELSDHDKQEYRQKSSKAKADFRLKWAKESLESCMKTVGNNTIYECNTVDKTVGKYKSCWAIFREEGGTTQYLQATGNICSKCMQMGFPCIE